MIIEMLELYLKDYHSLFDIDKNYFFSFLHF